MHSDWETFIAAYTKASSDVKKLIDSDILVNFASTLVEKYQIREESKPVLIAQISDLILSLMTTNELVEHVRSEHKLSEENIKQFLYDIKQFLGNPSRPVEASPHIETSQSFGESIKISPANGVVQDNATLEDASINSQLQEKEELLNPQQNPQNISPLRTMQSDAERIHGYGAYRRKHPQDADAPKPGSTLKPLSDLPRYENNERDSE